MDVPVAWRRPMKLLSLNAIVVATDLTATSRGAMQSAGRLAQSGGAALHVVHVAPPGTELVARSGHRAEFMHEIAVAAADAGIAAHTPHVLVGDAAAAIAEFADRVGASVVVTGRRRSDTPFRADRPVGGTAFAVITRSAVPILAVTEAMSLPVARVVVAIDCSEASRGAMLVGLSWASALRDRARDAMLTVLHVHDHDRGLDMAAAKRVVDHELDVLRRSAGDWAGVHVSGVTIPGGEPVEEIARYASGLEAGLVVAGTRGVGRSAAGDLGSVSAALLSRVAEPVLLVPPAVWRNHTRDMDYL
jgi:universal stress protein E